MAHKGRLIFAGLVIGMLLAGCTSVEEEFQLRKPTARLMDVRFRDADVYGATLVFDVQIVNHYAFDLPLLRFRYTMSSRGVRFLAGLSDVAIRVPAFGSETVSLPTRIDYVQTLRALGSVRPGATIPYAAEVDLTIDTPRLGSILLDLGKSGELTLPEVSGENLEKLLEALRAS